MFFLYYIYLSAIYSPIVISSASVKSVGTNTYYHDPRILFCATAHSWSVNVNIKITNNLIWQEAILWFVNTLSHDYKPQLLVQHWSDPSIVLFQAEYKVIIDERLYIWALYPQFYSCNLVQWNNYHRLQTRKSLVIFEAKKMPMVRALAVQTRSSGFPATTSFSLSSPFPQTSLDFA